MPIDIAAKARLWFLFMDALGSLSHPLAFKGGLSTIKDEASALSSRLILTPGSCISGLELEAEKPDVGCTTSEYGIGSLKLVSESTGYL